MKRLHVLAAALGAVVALAGCASRADLDARYDASLQRWRGATQAELEAAWGRPTLAQPADGGTALTWVVRNDIETRKGSDGVPTVVVPSGTAPKSVSVIQPQATYATVPITCTTRFLLKDGRVESWKFQGMGCGAPY